jgi:hypothetical protein
MSPSTTPYEFFFDGKRYESNKSSVTGLEIKVMVGVEGSYQLYLEEEGQTPDQAISDQGTVSLEPPIKHFFAVPPAIFGQDD